MTMTTSAREVSVGFRSFARFLATVFVATILTTTFFLRAASGRESAPGRSALFQKASFELDGLSTIAFLERYSKTFKFNYFVDRRVDPSTPLSGEVSGRPLVDAFDSIFSSAGLSFCVVGDNCVYVGPENAATEVLLRFDVARAKLALGDYPREIAERLSAPITLTIQPYSEPRKAFAALFQKAKLKSSGFDKTTFDVWRGSRFENLPVADILAILTLGFEVDYEYDASSRSIRPVAFDRENETFIVVPKAIADRLTRSKFPGAKFAAVKGLQDATRVSGKFSALLAVEEEIALLRRDAAAEESVAARNSTDESPRSSRGSSRLRGASGKREGGVRTLVSGSVVNKTLRDLFDYLEKNANIVCELDPELETAGTTLDARVTCEFKNADASKVASIIGRQIGAKYEIVDGAIVFSKK